MIGIGSTVRWIGQQGECWGVVRDITSPDNATSRVLWVDIDGGGGDVDLFPINEDKVTFDNTGDATADIDTSGRGMDQYGSLD